LSCYGHKQQLSFPAGLKVIDLDFENKVVMQTDIIEKQIDVEGLTVHGEWHLAACKGEAAAQLQEKIP
jgi:hypothetical protein